jgi:hypothetical protein
MWELPNTNPGNILFVYSTPSDFDERKILSVVHVIVTQ